MSFTYAQVLERLADIERGLANLIPEESAQHPAAKYFRAKRDYERAWAVEYLKTEGTVDERRNKTIIATYNSDAYKALVTAEAEYESNKAVGRVLETRASIGQSLLRASTRESGQNGQQPSWSGAGRG